MVKCKLMQDNPATCGKNICCYTCEEFENCQEDDRCGDFDTVEDAKNCADAEEMQEITDLGKAVPEVLKKMQTLLLEKKPIKAQEAELKEKMKQAMEEHGIKSWKNDFFSVTYVAPTTRTSIDSAKLKKELPEIAEKYSKTSKVASSIRVKVND